MKELFKFQGRVIVRNHVVNTHDRIAAKARLWDFLRDIQTELLNWTDTDIDLAREIVGASLHFLFPHFTVLEIEKEIRNIYSTLQKDVPPGYVQLFTDCYSNIILAKLKRVK